MSRYVPITRQEFEQFLKQFRKPFALKQGTKGIYIISLSDNVGLAVNSTIGDTVRGVGKASIKLNFVSLHEDKFHRIIYGYKKIMARVVGKKYLQRSTNWRVTLGEAIDKCIKYYNSGSNFFEKIAVPEDESGVPQQSTGQSQMLQRIESIPNWKGNKFLVSLHDQASKGRTLSPKQLAILEKLEAKSTSTPAPAPTQPAVVPQQNQQGSNLEKMRDLYVSLRSAGASADDLEEVADIGKALKVSNSLKKADMETLSEICADYNVSLPNFNFGKRASKGNWNKVQVGNKVSEVYYRGIPTGSIQKVASGYEAFFNDFGRPKSLGVFKSEKQAFAKIQKEKK